MSGVDDFLSKGSGQHTSRYQGVVVPDPDSPSALAVNVAGNILPARVMDPTVVVAGDVVVVDVVRESRGLSAAWVIGRAADRFRPGEATVKVVPVGSETITVTGTDGIDYTAKFDSSYSPVVNDRVTLNWNAATPTVLGKVGVTAAPPTPSGGVAPPPAPPQTGQSTYQAIQSQTYWPGGGWGTWASDGSHVYQGNYGGLGMLTGAWFYGGATSELAGRTITRIRIVLGRRRPVGSSNAAATVHFKSHTSANRPGGNVALGSGSTDVTADPGQGSREYDLSLNFAANLQAGGGICITGDPYCGFDGIAARADSGLLIIDWAR